MASNKYFQELEIEIVEESDNYTKVVAEPFDRGYGVTIGNTLRRSLLTSIPGAAITSIKIDGVSHEFTSIKGVLEDISEAALATIWLMTLGIMAFEAYLARFTYKFIQSIKLLSPEEHLRVQNIREMNYQECAY